MSVALAPRWAPWARPCFACIAALAHLIDERTTCCSSEDIPVPRTHNNQAVSGCLALNARATALRTEESFRLWHSPAQADDRPGEAPVGGAGEDFMNKKPKAIVLFLLGVIISCIAPRAASLGSGSVSS